MKRTYKTGVTCAAFGLGLLTATILPARFVLILVAIALVLAGCSCVKSF